jgi:C4-type Zn-finger protein
MKVNNYDTVRSRKDVGIGMRCPHCNAMMHLEDCILVPVKGNNLLFDVHCANCKSCIRILQGVKS